MIEAFIRALAQLTDRKTLVILLKVVLLTVLLFALFGIMAYFGLHWLFAWLGWAEGGFAAAAAAAIIAILTGVLLFRIVAIFVLNIFSDDIVDAVERRYYPERAERAKPPGYATGIRMGLASAGRALGYNILAIPLYVLLLVTGVGVPIAFFTINAILLGRDLQDMVAARHVEDYRNLSAEWSLPKLQRFILGLIAALLLAVPFVNFLAPVLAAAMASHLVHGKKKE
ncbi:EI24 domain-containing protein [Sphingorhabdus sp. SMR4y]|uniref:EI24 domain-containing protein n=1 Tax=Sphingorhabdus sp. SMR4y TaxID=2584094 RepID=UPI000B5D0086|nr:EI24 domain-containing protein [Sphingorhabdus sp. SMR4y]ASK88521.1 CysZ-like protein [Sphingorhabdus sp. SMR4y]